MPKIKITSSEEREISSMILMLDAKSSGEKTKKWLQYISKHFGDPFWKVKTIAKRLGYNIKNV